MMPDIPETIIATLACTSPGAIRKKLEPRADKDRSLHKLISDGLRLVDKPIEIVQEEL